MSEASDIRATADDLVRDVYSLAIVRHEKRCRNALALMAREPGTGAHLAAFVASSAAIDDFTIRMGAARRALGIAPQPSKG